MKINNNNYFLLRLIGINYVDCSIIKNNIMKKLNTGIAISYNKNGNIKACVSIYDNTVTNKPLPKSNSFKTHASYQSLNVESFNQWSNKHC